MKSFSRLSRSARSPAALLALITCISPMAAWPSAPEPANATFPDAAQVQALLSARIGEGRAKGLAVALLAPRGEPVFLSAGDSGQPARPGIDADTIFEIGSITKTFTGTLLAQMSLEGLVRPTDRVRDHAPRSVQFRAGTAGDVTLQQLATHTSGLPRLPLGWAFLKSMMAGRDNPYARYTPEDMWAYLAERKVDARATHPTAYSNLGMGLLGDLLAHRAGTTFGELVASRITRPLAMTDSGIATPAAAQHRLAVGHTKKLKPTSYWDFPSMAAAGALRSTPRDMVKYVQAQRDGTLAGAKLAQESRAGFSGSDRVGYGWLILTAYVDDIVWHNGGTGGFRSFAGFSTKTGKAVVVLANSEHDVDDIGLHLLNAALKLKTEK